MRSERVVEAELLAAIRSSGTTSIESVEAVILEADGSFNVLTAKGEESGSALQDVNGRSR